MKLEFLRPPPYRPHRALHCRSRPKQMGFATAYAQVNFHSKNNELFVKDVDAATGGKLKITPHFGASLFKCPRSSAPCKPAMRRWASSFVSFRTNRRSSAWTACHFW